MRVFVASWFFPPETSSEGIVTYKLLRNSRNAYDVCSAASDQWGYKHELPMNADNVTRIPIKTDDVQEWVEQAIKAFEENHAREPYDVIMTRTMPPESVLVGDAVKKAHPEVKWVASLADPVARSPYMLKDLVLDNPAYDDTQKWDLITATMVGFGIETLDDDVSNLLRSYKQWEDLAVNGSDVLITPHDTLSSYILGSRQRRRVFAVPHSYDTELVEQARQATAGHLEDRARDEHVTEFVFLGHTDKHRSLDGLVMALRHIQKTDPRKLDGIRVRCIGHIAEQTRNLIYNYQLHDVVVVEESVDYLTSLVRMEQADWLVHVDAWFDSLADTGGSVFFAGKIADYLGTDRPILGITGTGSPAEQIIARTGGVCVDPHDIAALARTLVGIAEGAIAPAVERSDREAYDAVNVAAGFDDILDDLLAGPQPFDRATWPALDAEAQERADERGKLISICVPSYNVECYLDRCLFSLVSCKTAPLLEVIVVNDGSKDATIDIARAYEQRYPGIVRVIDKENGGHGSTINAALEVAEGTYFRVIDSDDWVDSKSMDELVNGILDKGVAADLVSTNYYQVYFDDGHTVAWEKEGPANYWETYQLAAEDFSMEYFTMASAMWKTALLRRAQFKLQEHTFYVDVEYLLYPIPYTYSVVFTPEPVYRYAVGNADQSINPSTFTNRYDHHDRVIRRMLEYYAQHRPTLTDGQDGYMRSLFRRHLLQSHYLLSLVWDPDRERGLARAADFDMFLRQIDQGLWEDCAAQYPAVDTARRRSFDPARIAKPASMQDGGNTLHARASRGMDKLKNNKVVDTLWENDAIRTTYQKIRGRG